MLRTLIVDDHRALRESLAEQLERNPRFEVVGACESAEEALEWLGKHGADLVILDVWMDGMGGVQGCREMKDGWPEIKVLMLTSNQEREAVLGCMLAGADGYVVKKSGREELRRALDRVADGDKFLDPEVTDIVLRQLAPLPSADPTGGLSPRERDTLELLSKGLTNRQISLQLGVSEKVARNYVARILDKLGFQRRAQAAAWASQNSNSLS